MNKTIKIIIFVLIILSITFSILFYFDLWPFSKRSALVSPEITPESTKLPVSRLPFPCTILDDEYCPKGELVYDGDYLVGLGFKLPEGTKVKTPLNGYYEGAEEALVEINGKHYPALDLRITASEDWAQQGKLTYFFVIGLHQLVIEKGVPVGIEKGQVFASLGNSTVINSLSESLGDYNLILTFRDVNTQTGEWSNNFNSLKEIFNYIDY